MSTIKAILHIVFVLLVTLTLAFNVTGTIPVQAQTNIRLNTADWSQIKASLPAVIIDAQQAYLKSSNTNYQSYFGDVVAIDGDTLVVGSYGESSNAVGVNGDQFNHLASDSGAVYVFIHSGNTWSQQAYLKASNTAAGDRFGSSVAISGDTIVVGAWGEGSNATGVDGNQANNSASFAGAAYVFTRTGNNWSQQAYLKASNTRASDRFGSSVAISGNTIIVGAPFENGGSSGVNGNQTDYSGCNAGAAYAFSRNGSTWSQQAYLKASNNDEKNCASGNYDYFGSSVTISGDTIAVGCPFEDSSATGVNGNQMNDDALDSGAVYVFTRSGSDWSQQAYLKASNTDGYTYTDDPENFGQSISIAGDTIVVGAPGEDSNATGVNGNQVDNSASDSGAAYVFARNGIAWSQQAYLKASNTNYADLFGYSVAVSGDTVVVGAFGEDSSATGVNGNQTDNSSSLNTGAAYAFVRSGNTWGQTAYLKASNTESSQDFSDDMFGWSVGVSGNTILTGAPGEDGNDIGVNGDQANNSAGNAGAAYVFALPPLVAFSQPANPNPTAASSVDFAVAFSEPMTNVDVADFALTTTGGITNASITNVSGGPTAYTVTVNAGSGDGTLRLDVFDNDTILNANLIPLGGAGAGNGGFATGKSYTIDRTAPIVSSIARTSANPTSLTSVGFKVIFSEPVIGIDKTDFALTVSGVTNASITSVSGSGTTYIVTVKTGNGNGTIRLDLPMAATFTDRAGNTPVNLPFTSGASYTVNKILTITSVGAPDGWILESSETSGVGGTLNNTATTIALGDNAANDQYRAILHFNSASLPDTAIITKATLKINKAGAVIGADPFTTHGNLIVDLSEPFFGTSAALQLSDFQGSAAVGIFGAIPVNNWYSALLDNNGKTYINRTGTTQFRLRFAKDDDNDHIADFVRFYSGDFSKDAYRPTLVIEYYVP